jgi:hypothetical protein
MSVLTVLISMAVVYRENGYTTTGLTMSRSYQILKCKIFGGDANSLTLSNRAYELVASEIGTEDDLLDENHREHSKKSASVIELGTQISRPNSAVDDDSTEL